MVQIITSLSMLLLGELAASTLPEDVHALSPSSKVAVAGNIRTDASLSAILAADCGIASGKGNTYISPNI